MAMEKVLQLAKLVPAGEAALRDRYEVFPFYEAPDREEWVNAHGAAVRAVVTSGHDGLSNDLADRLPALGIIAISGVGYDRIDLERARRKGYRVTNTPDVLTDDVADAGIGMMIMAMRNFQAAGQYLRDGRWPNEGDLPLASKVSGKRYGIYGLGRIGEAIAARLNGFGGSISYSSRAPKAVPYRYYATVLALAEASDVLFVAAAALPETRGIINQAVLDALGPQGFLVNMSRGALVDEPALVSALRDGRIAGAGLDVFAAEPHVPHELFSLPNVALTPHLGSATMAAREAMAQVMVSNLEAFFANRPLPTPVV
ncbi:MAG: 2-hydroxyacid dehydrogenase [Devosia sp.]